MRSGSFHLLTYKSVARGRLLATRRPYQGTGANTAVVNDMHQERVHLAHSEGLGFVIPLGPVSLVGVVARKGMVGCGAFDVAALNNFGYPAARVRATKGPSVTSIDDLLSGEVREANEAAIALGVVAGMAGRSALDLLS